jgi:hypothetical protein
MSKVILCLGIFAIISVIVFGIYLYMTTVFKYRKINKKYDKIGEELEGEWYCRSCEKLSDTALQGEHIRLNKLAYAYDKENNDKFNYDEDQLRVECKLGFIEEEMGKRNIPIPDYFSDK